jgi:hypothetical protein
MPGIGNRITARGKPRLAVPPRLGHISTGEGVPMDHRKMSEGQRAYEAKRASKAGVSLERWLDQKAKEAAAERAAAAKAQQPEPAAAKKKPGFLARLLEKAQKPL